MAEAQLPAGAGRPARGGGVRCRPGLRARLMLGALRSRRWRCRRRGLASTASPGPRRWPPRRWRRSAGSRPTARCRRGSTNGCWPGSPGRDGAGAGRDACGGCSTSSTGWWPRTSPRRRRRPRPRRGRQGVTPARIRAQVEQLARALATRRAARRPGERRRLLRRAGAGAGRGAGPAGGPAPRRGDGGDGGAARAAAPAGARRRARRAAGARRALPWCCGRCSPGSPRRRRRPEGWPPGRRRRARAGTTSSACCSRGCGWWRRGSRATGRGWRRRWPSGPRRSAARTPGWRGSTAERRRFFADVGHELRTPLTVILGEAELGRGMRTRRCARASRRSTAGRCGWSGGSRTCCGSRGRRAASSSSSARRSISPPRRAAALADAAPLLARAGVAARPTLPALAVTGDADWLRQVFAGLLENAAKYAGPRRGGGDRRAGRGGHGGGRGRRQRAGGAARAAGGGLRPLQPRRRRRRRASGSGLRSRAGWSRLTAAASGRRRRRRAGCGW